MDAAPFDTHAVVKDLVAAGFTEQQAEAQVQALMRLAREQLATKWDILELQKDIAEIRRDIADVKRDIKELESSTKRDLKELEMRLTIRLGAMLVVAVGALAILEKIL
jgi:hypothetical protein